MKNLLSLLLFVSIGTGVLHLASGGNFPQVVFETVAKERTDWSSLAPDSVIVSFSERWAEYTDDTGKNPGYTVAVATFPPGGKATYKYVRGPEEGAEVLPPNLLVPQSSLMPLDDDGAPMQLPKGGVDAQLDEYFRKFLESGNKVFVAYKNNGNDAFLEFWCANAKGKPVPHCVADTEYNWVQAILVPKEDGWKLNSIRGLTV